MSIAERMFESPPVVPVPGSTEEPFREPLSSLSVELQRISAEIQSINSGFQAQIQQAIAETQATLELQYARRLEKALGEARMEFEMELERRLSSFKQVKPEMQRVSAQLNSIAAEVTKMIDDPNVELSKVMRKKTEHAELKAYFDGLRFALGEP